MKWKLLLLALIPLLICAGCAAGNPQFDSDGAGFWAGLWHGFICVVTFIISLFNDSVRIYEEANTGHLYDLGFVIGAACFFGGGCGCGSSSKSKWSCCTSKEEKEWDEIGDKVEAKVRKGIRECLEESEKKDEDWEEIGQKIEDKIKRELRNWADS